MEKFRDLPYKRPDVRQLKKEFAQLLKQSLRAKTFEEADEAFVGYLRVMDRWDTLYTIALIRRDGNVKDKFYEEEVSFFNRESTKMMLTLKKGIKAVLSSPFLPQFKEKYGEQLFKSFETQLKLIKPSVILPTIREGNLCAAYSGTAASCSVEFMGEKCNSSKLWRHMSSTDRAERKAAFAAWAGFYESISGKLDRQYDKLVKTRCTIAKRLGFKSYIEYAYLARGRYDYGPEKAAAFREAVRTYITPLCEKLYREQAERLGLDRLEVCDEDLCFPDGNAMPLGTPEELVEKARQMYGEMSPETGEFFDFMAEHELYDLETRENKARGGSTKQLADYKAPFIFSNFNGTSADVYVLTHEAGHAFQGYYAARRLPLSLQVETTSEIAEIHSMAMELLTFPYMERFFGDRTDRYRYAHFTEAIKLIPYIAAVDEFQHRVFEDPGMSPADRHRLWRGLEKKYMPWRSYDGSAFMEGGGWWQHQGHIFAGPFYFIEYALAQLDAFALYRKQIEGGDAWGTYLALCGMGGRYGYFETLERAGLPDPLDAENVRELAEFAERYADVLKSRLSEAE